jgi:hypothetical protein
MVKNKAVTIEQIGRSTGVRRKNLDRGAEAILALRAFGALPPEPPNVAGAGPARTTSR